MDIWEDMYNKAKKEYHREDMKVIKHGLLIPDKVSNYEEFVQSIRQSEKKFVEYFCFNYNSMDFIKER